MILSVFAEQELETLCIKPKPPDYGYLEGDDYDDGGVVFIYCIEGYRLHGPTNITCIPVPHPNARGVWLPEDAYYCTSM